MLCIDLKKIESFKIFKKLWIQLLTVRGIIMENKIVAAIISLFLPGIGQYLLGRGKNWLFVFIAVVIVDIILAYALGAVGTYVAGLIGLVFAADAYAGFIGDL